MNKKNINKILDLLDKNYFGLKCYLNYEFDWQLLIATILSAQCTDDRVNLVTRDLFNKYKNLDDFANADKNILEQDIKSTGFYKHKAKYIILCSQELIKKNKIMPNDICELIKLPGVGRKTANVIRSHVFNIPSIVVDTHVMRVSKRLGFTKNNYADQIEQDLIKILPEKNWIRYNLQIISHGRKICRARKAKCSECFLKNLCEYKNKNLDL